jgi:hypothetical protein
MSLFYFDVRNPGEDDGCGEYSWPVGTGPTRVYTVVNLVLRQVGLTGIAFLALYLAFNKLTERHEFMGLGLRSGALTTA